MVHKTAISQNDQLIFWKIFLKSVAFAREEGDIWLVVFKKCFLDAIVNFFLNKYLAIS